MKLQMSKFGAEVTTLVKAIQQGQDKTEELYKLTYTHLEMVAFHYLFTKTYIEDVMSEAYLKIFKYISKADVNRNCYNWMCKIVQNTASDYNKANYFSKEVEDISCVSSYNVEDYVAEKSDLTKLIENLPSEDWQLIYYKYFEDLSYSEVARQVGLKKNYVYKRIKAIIKNISKELKNYGND